MTTTVRTRFAPSPTGYLHIGGARTALFSWAYARHHGGKFILRIEDTDLARSTPEAVQAIIDGMNWLGLEHDEGPFYQMQRMERYKEVIQQMLAAGTAYYCYTSKEELDALRSEQEARKEKPRYDGRWRPMPGKALPPVPAGVQPVVRFKNPFDGVVAWDDLVKGRIEIANTELDDFIIARADGTPTYNFCVVVDDWDMGITQVIRGDDHVNNTPRQINVLIALGAQVPQYAHLSMILGDDGAKLSKRHGAVSVMQYADEGYLPDAVINYLARLSWSHGDDEIFSRTQFVEWFDLSHITPSAAQFNTEKLNWLNAQYIKAADNADLAQALTARLDQRGINTQGGPGLAGFVALYKERVSNLNEFADAAAPFYQPASIPAELAEKHFTATARAALASLAACFIALPEWEKTALDQAIKDTMKAHGLKMPQVAIPLRVALLGVEHTPSIDAVLELLGREQVLQRLGQL
ncbi:glutamate--tRNA ligase [Betaproteobacteria bacterium]|nr:glutamate--tRNA ligase [Betaproteobacteria bacterium]GHU18545.1 glutamate--tRNA ligase [Betaproteobacteria bacterium]